MKDKKPNTIFRLTSPTIEVDLNHDGKKEIIGSYGTELQTEIYKLNEDNRIVYVSLNKALHAKSVIFNEKEGLFEAYFEENIIKRYKYVDETLVELH